MTLVVEQSTAFEANAETGITGLVGTIEVSVVDNDGNTVTGPTSANITENVVGTPTGNYTWNNPAAPATIGQYQLLWSTDGSFDPETVASEDLVVVTQSTDAVLPPIPAPVDGGLGFGPCTAWASGDDVADCCSVEASSGAIFDQVVDQASQLLYELSGRRFGGLCGPVTVRPPCDCACWGAQRLAYASGGSRLIWAGAYWNWGSYPFGCCGVSRVKLSGYPIREITQVKINGDVIPADEYRLDESRYVTRLDGARWPACQDSSLADTEEGTFSISYTYGQSPPLMGAQAAAQLACELYKACANATGSGGDCALPSGVTRQVRQGITIERMAFTSWAYLPASQARGGRSAGWNTGLSLVDSFLNAYNSSGLMRRPTFSAPGHRYPRPVV